MLHELKCWPRQFNATRAGTKTHEVRVFDRPYAVGDDLLLREWVPSGGGRYTGRELDCEVTYMTRPGEFGLPATVCVMTIKVTGTRIVT